MIEKPRDTITPFSITKIPPSCEDLLEEPTRSPDYIVWSFGVPLVHCLGLYPPGSSLGVAGFGNDQALVAKHDLARSQPYLRTQCDYSFTVTIQGAKFPRQSHGLRIHSISFPPDCLETLDCNNSWQ
jgi:hypothetical protein